MARIEGVDLPRNKRTEVGLTYLFGVGPTRARKILAVGREAKEMMGRTPGAVSAIRPIKEGVIADFEVTEAMLRYFINKAHNRRTLVKPRIVICVPNGITEVEKRAVRESAESAGILPHGPRKVASTAVMAREMPSRPPPRPGAHRDHTACSPGSVAPASVPRALPGGRHRWN